MVTSSASSTKSDHSTQSVSLCLDDERKCLNAKCKSTCELEQEVEKCEVEYSFPDINATCTNETHDSSNHEHIRECVDAQCKPTCESEQEQVKCKIEDSFTDSIASWTNENGELQSVDCLCLDINIDTLTTNKAMFKLSCSVFLKKKDNNKLSIFLFILPPSVCAIELKTDGDIASLRFCMNKDAALVIPRDGRLAPKGRSEQLLNLMRALSHVKDFTIQLGNTEISESTKLNLGHVATIFSPNNLSRPEPKEINLKSLYGGRGGEIINATAATINVSSKASPPPPPYPSKKRKRKHRYSVSDDDEDVVSDSRLEARLADLQARLDDTEARVAELEAVREEYEGEEVSNEVGRLVKDFTRSSMLEDMVDHLVKHFMKHLNTDMDDIFDEKLDIFERIIDEFKQDVKGDCMKAVEQIMDEFKREVMEDCMKAVLEALKRYMTDLIHTGLELSFTKKEL